MTQLRDATTAGTTTAGTSVSAVSADGSVRVEIGLPRDTATPCLRPMILDRGPLQARVALVPDSALLLAGDAVRVDVSVGAGVRLDLVEPAGTVAFDMRGGQASWDVRIHLGPGATLVWAGEPFVVATGARVRRSTTAYLGEGARLAMRETLVMGRHDETGGHLEQTWAAYRSDGVALLVEQTVLDEQAHRPGILGGQRAVGTVLALGLAFDDAACVEGRLDLEAGGTLWRALDRYAHRVALPTAWQAALAAV